jgi:hypothetical protein
MRHHPSNELGPWDVRVQLGPKLRRTVKIVGLIFLGWLIIQTLYVLAAAAMGS